MCINSNMAEVDLGYYARVLLDVDHTKALKYQLILDCDSQFLKIEVCYESLPLFFRNCNSIGHDLGSCKFLSNKVQPSGTNKDEMSKPTKEWKRKGDVQAWNSSEVSVKKSFDALWHAVGYESKKDLTEPEVIINLEVSSVGE